MRVTICVCTYKRPRGLERLLEGLAVLIFKKTEAPAIEVVVVDNEVSAVNESICAGFKKSPLWPIRYVTEPERGISFARNKALASVSGDTDFIAFIDDDEVPDPLWLDELLHAQARYNADVVQGAVISVFEEEAPRWIHEGNFFEKSRHYDGELLTEAFTNNVLVRFSIIGLVGLRFDAKYALSGGEDILFFTTLYRAGFRIVWAEDACVHEWIPRHRMNAGWIVRRGFRWGNIRARIFFVASDDKKEKRRLFAETLKYAYYDLRWIPRSLVRGKSDTVLRARSLARHAGWLAGLLRIRYDEYR